MEKHYQEHLVGVFGDPVDDNPTVVLEQAAFNACKLPYRYLTIQVKKGGLRDAMAGLRAMNFTGINITMPHKTEVLHYLDEVAEDAQVMGAVNTVYWKNGRLCGANTDGKGFMKSLSDAGISVRDKHALLLGAGGAARAIAVELANAGVRQITIFNRSEENGRALENLLRTETPAHVDFHLWKGPMAIPADADLVIQATPIGFQNASEKPELLYDSLLPGMVACDVIPNRVHTPFLDLAASKGCQTLNGLQMLVNQGALAFELWTGQQAPIAVMTKALKEAYNL